MRLILWIVSGWSRVNARLAFVNSLGLSAVDFASSSLPVPGDLVNDESFELNRRQIKWLLHSLFNGNLI